MKKTIIALLLLLSLACAARAETVTIAGREYDAALEALDLSRVTISDVDALEEALCAMPNLTWVDLSFCRLRYATLAELRDRMAARGVKVVWTVRFGDFTVRTDATAFSTLHSGGNKTMEEDDFLPLQYCTDLIALDLGHNRIFTIDFIAPLTKLRVVILSDNHITDLSPLDGKPLEYLEAFNNRVQDISWLADCETLVDLNLCLTHVSDLTPLYDLPNLRRVYISSTNNRDLSQEEIDAFLAYKGEDLEAWNFFSQYPTEYGWRETNGVLHPRYEVIKRMFSTGVYIPFSEEDPLP